ncbi:MAG: CoA transferase, partial [Burkholderiaceae bacterium]|nr:CoA transferase [Burkholderiaceae bacterium]
MTLRGTPNAPRSLQGLRVVDFTTMIAGPYCTRCLADSGAEVIKVEEPGGDFMRNFAPLREGQSAYFGTFNGGKKSVELDLKSPAGLLNARALIDSADVVVENFRPGVMKRFGLDYETVARSNPRLIYCAISGYGQDGPGADSPAYAHVIHARSGFDHAWMGYQDPPRRPANSAIFFADVLAAIYGFSAILTALYQRTQTGQGQFIDVALLECMLGMLPYEVQAAQFPALTPRPVYPPVRTSDGFLMLAPVSPRTVEGMLSAVELTGWREDSRFATASARLVHWAEMMA